MRSALLGVLLLTVVTARAGGEHWPVGARFAGLGHANLTLVDLWSVRGNQAGLAGLEHPVAGAYYQQHWLSPDLGMQGLAFAMPLGKGCIAVNGSMFGSNGLYAEQQYGLAYAIRLSDNWRVGVQLDYLNLRFGENYGRTGTVTGEVGLQAKLARNLWIGAHLYNPNRAKLGGPYDELVPTILGAGLSYTFNEQVQLAVQVDKDIDRQEQYRAGIEYRPAKALFVRAGVSSGPVQGYGGVGVRVKGLEIDLAVAGRSQLGITPMFNLNYRFE